MGVLDQIFGSELPLAVRFLIAFAVVLGLIALTAWLVRRLAGRKLPIANAGRARQPRLGVLDAFAIDARRRLVLIRRDNVEHLIMIGGPNDVVVESQIVRAPAQGALAPQRTGRQAPGEAGRTPVAPPVVPQQQPQPGRGAVAGAAPAAGPGRSTVPLPPPAPPASVAPEPPPAKPGFFRATINRPAAATSPSVSATPPGDTGFRPVPPAPREPAAARGPERAPEPVVTPPPAPPQPSPAAASAKPKAEVDPLFADIERQLEQALGRTGGPSATPPQAPASRPAPAATTPTPAARRPEPRPERPEPRPERSATPPRKASDTPASDKSHLDALEEEMASLLGRNRPQ